LESFRDQIVQPEQASSRKVADLSDEAHEIEERMILKRRWFFG
jgi:hypothetical protein